MKTPLPLIFALLVVGFAGVATAQPVADPSPASIGVQFSSFYGPNPYTTPYQGENSVLNETNVNGNANQYGYQAGAVNQQYWNVANNSANPGPGNVTVPLDNTSLLSNNNGTASPAAPVLIDSNGNATSVLFQLSNSTNNDHTATGGNFPSSQWYAQNGSTPVYLVTGVQASNSASNPVTLALAGLNDTDYYNLYAYVGSLWYYGSTNAAVNLGSTTYDLKTDGGTLTNYTLSTATSASGAPIADYVEFTNVLGSDLSNETLTVTGAGTGLSGFQLVDIGSTLPSVPEPSTVWMFSLGFLGLMAHVYRSATPGCSAAARR